MAELDDLEPLPVNGSSGAHHLDSNTLVDYLSRLLDVTLGASRNELEAQGSLLSHEHISHTIKTCTRFLSEAQVALYAQKIAVSSTVDDMQQDVQG